MRSSRCTSARVRPSKILYDGLVVERVDLDGVHRPALRADALAQPREVRAAAHQHGDRLLRPVRELLLEDRDDLLGSRPPGRRCAPDAS